MAVTGPFFGPTTPFRPTFSRYFTVFREIWRNFAENGENTPDHTHLHPITFENVAKVCEKWQKVEGNREISLMYTRSPTPTPDYT